MAWTELTTSASSFSESRVIDYLLMETGDFLLNEAAEKIELDTIQNPTWAEATAHAGNWS